MGFDLNGVYFLICMNFLKNGPYSGNFQKIINIHNIKYLNFQIILCLNFLSFLKIPSVPGKLSEYSVYLKCT